MTSRVSAPALGRKGGFRWPQAERERGSEALGERRPARLKGDGEGETGEQKKQRGGPGRTAEAAEGRGTASEDRQPGADGISPG